MRHAHAFAMLLGTVGFLLFALTGNGQEKLGLAGRGDSLRLALLRTPQVQRELKLTGEQQEKISRLQAETKELKKQVELAHGKGQKGQPKANPNDTIAVVRERQVRAVRESALDELERQVDERLAAILDKRQLTRLTQIVLRVEGPSAFLTPEVIEKIALQPEQVDAIREILDAMKAESDQYKEVQKQSFELAKAGGEFDLEKVRKEQQKGQSRAFAYKLGKQAMPRVARVLSRQQRDLYNRMLGEPYDLSGLSSPDGRPLIDESADLRAWLLRQHAVQVELALTAMQKDQLAKDAPVGKVLEVEQRHRLGQLELQADGIAVLMRPEVIRALRIDPEQLEQIQVGLDGLVGENRRLHDVLKAAPTDPAAARIDQASAKEQAKAMLRAGSVQLRERLSRRLGTVLTRRQNEILKRMLGEPFDFSKVGPVFPDRGRDVPDGANEENSTSSSQPKG